MDDEVTTNRKFVTESGMAAEVILVETRYRNWRCGYVSVPEGHPLYGIEYNAECPVPEKLIKREVGDVRETLGLLGLFCLSGETTPAHALWCHGGVTFSGPRGGKGWWFGFDCCHVDDTMAEWTEQRVADECEKLAEQIAAWGPPFVDRLKDDAE